MHWWQRCSFFFWLGHEVYELNWIKNLICEHGIIIYVTLSLPSYLLLSFSISFWIRWQITTSNGIRVRLIDIKLFEIAGLSFLALYIEN